LVGAENNSRKNRPCIWGELGVLGMIANRKLGRRWKRAPGLREELSKTRVTRELGCRMLKIKNLP